MGRYQLLEPIGSGPCGAVSRAKVFGVAGFERQFAIKRFHPEITASTSLASALSAAARGYGSLEHPRIARMSEFGVAQGTTFTAVEFVAGLDAHRLITEARLSGAALAAGGALALVSQAARAVGYAHGRGLTHLGLAPTNVVVTSEGDIKITDFGILAATLPSRPIDALRLAHRVQYLAPEQLSGESTSAATDVFSLGVLAYELVTGQRAYQGDTPQQVAQAVLAGPPAEPPLPRPIVRVLQRCLARSPFERFPDARALADALDAALRVAPVPGTRKDIGAQVKATMDRLAALNEGEHSGILALNVVANAPAPARKEPLSAVSVLGNKDPRNTKEMPSAGDSSLDLTTIPDTKRPIVSPMTTVAGLAPPPSKLPPGVTPPPPIPGLANATMLGAPGKAPPAVAAIKPMTPGAVPAKPARMSEADPGAGAVPPLGAPRRPPMINPETQPGVQPPVKIPDGKQLTPSDDTSEIEIEIDKALKPMPNPETDPGVGIQPAAPADRAQRPTDEMSAALANQLKVAATKPTRDIQKFVPPVGDAPDDELDMSFAETAMVSDSKTIDTVTASSGRNDDDDGDDVESGLDRTVLGTGAPLARAIATKPGFEAPPKDARPGPVGTVLTPTGKTPIPSGNPLIPAGKPPISTPALPPVKLAVSNTPPVRPPVVMPPRAAEPAPANQQQAQTAHVPAQKPSRKGLWAILAIVLVGGLGVGGFFAYQQFIAPKEAANGSKPVAVATDAGTAVSVADAAQIALATDGASASPPADAQVAAVVVDAGAAAPADAAQVAATIDAGVATPPATGDNLSITSTPAGARVFLDGADSGVTPLKLPGTADKHSIALFLPAHELYLAQVDGKGTFNIQMKSVTPLAGPAGIKVTRCKDKDRYYIAVDGKPTGMSCPTERIQVELGQHTVDVYDLQTEKHTEYKVDVTDTRLSYRVKVDP